MNSEDMLHLAEVEREYGLKRSTMYSYVKKGLIMPYKRAGDRKSYFRRRELEVLTEFRPRKGVSRDLMEKQH